MTDPTIYTVGHSNKPGDQFALLLVQAGIDTIVDVRTSPYSRWNPQFNRDALEATLKAVGIRYDYRGKNLGGLGRNVDFDKTMDELAERVRGGEKLAMMCSEGSHKQCHRGDTLTAPSLARGLTVAHLQWTGKLVIQKPESTDMVAAPPPGLFDLPAQPAGATPRNDGRIQRS